MKKAIIGIDLGTVNTCVATYDGENLKILQTASGRTTPSYVFHDPKSENIFCGRVAQNKVNSNVIYDAKRFIGRYYNDPIVQQINANYHFSITSGPDNNIYFKLPYNHEHVEKKPEDITMVLLKYIKELVSADYECEDVDAVITVPAHFNHNQRNKTKQAATKAGINVLKLMNEPTAAALSYFYGGFKRNLKAMVFDLGGGTFDISIIDIDDDITVRAVAGDTFLGGRNFDENIARYFKEKFEEEGKTITMAEERRLKVAATMLKEALSFHETADTTIMELCGDEDVDLSLERDKFNEINQADFDKCLDLIKDCLEEHDMKPEDIDEIIMVGGSSKIPKLKEMIGDYFGKDKIMCDLDPDEAVAQGAALEAFLHSNKNNNKITNKLNTLKIIEVTSLTLGVSINYDKMSPIIPRNTPIPFSKTKIFYTSYDYQKNFIIGIFEGERSCTKFNNLLGTLLMENIPKLKAQEVSVYVTFAIDESGILSVSANCKDEKKMLTIDLNQTNAKDNEIAVKILDAENNRIYDSEFTNFVQAKMKLTEILNKYPNTEDFEFLLKQTSFEEQNKITKILHEARSSKLVKELKRSWLEYLGIKKKKWYKIFS